MERGVDGIWVLARFLWEEGAVATLEAGKRLADKIFTLEWVQRGYDSKFVVHQYRIHDPMLDLGRSMEQREKM